MKNPDALKLMVKEKYAAIANQDKEQNAASCCGATACCEGVDYSIFSESYTQIQGYQSEADLGLGCGLPTEFAQIKPGDTVIDLGSGAGNDCFVARALTGDTGKVIGIDMTEAMISKAMANAVKLGFTNVSFRLGDIEAMPVSANKADVVISNCVLNLVPDKNKAFSEIYRVLKPGGHLSVSDVVIKGQLPKAIQDAAEMYAGCVSGAIQLEEYLVIMKTAGLTNIRLQKEKAVVVPDDILLKYLNDSELKAFKSSGTGIFSITVYAEKAGASCGCGCC
ncbi:MAG: arsenite methyltransferase [Bacteroidetes bacterium]|nr:arsenite methyltransferase [Bacteroidota bacterium]